MAFSSLTMAAIAGNSLLMEKLILQGAQVNAGDDEGRTALHYAAEKDVSCVELLLKEGSDCNITDSFGSTPLHWAARLGKADCIKCLVTHGADVNARSSVGNTPLFCAAIKAELDAVKMLLDFNTDPSIENCKGELAVHKTMQTFFLHFDFDNDLCILDLLMSSLDRLPYLYASKEELQGVIPQLHLECTDRVRWKVGQTNEDVAHNFQQTLQILDGEVVPLKQICRCVIRKSLKRAYLPEVISKLPLPSKLKRYLLLAGDI